MWVTLSRPSGQARMREARGGMWTSARPCTRDGDGRGVMWVTSHRGGAAMTAKRGFKKRNVVSEPIACFSIGLFLFTQLGGFVS